VAPLFERQCARVPATAAGEVFVLYLRAQGADLSAPLPHRDLRGLRPRDRADRMSSQALVRVQCRG